MQNDPQIRPAPEEKIRLSKYPTDYTAKFAEKKEARKKLAEDQKEMAQLQDAFYAQGDRALLIIFQAMDAAGKDGTIKNVMSGINPQGCRVISFKQPSTIERAHDFLWRTTLVLPEKGMIGIFNRSYYEEVLITRVHPEFVLSQNIPGINKSGDINDKFWSSRFDQINRYESYLHNTGTTILKFFLHVGKDEQKQRFLDRMEKPEKNWKITSSDISERQFWNDYQHAYEEMLTHTNTAHAPWNIIPADHKWFMRVAVGDIVVNTLKTLKPRYPEISEKSKQDLLKMKKQLLNEG